MNWHTLWHAISHAFLHTVEEAALTLPILYITYLIMELLEHRAGDRVNGLISRAGKVAPLFGGLLGAVPQCGFSAAAAGLYAGRVISLGTLLAVFLSTSDEMVPVLLAGRMPPLSVLLLVGVKATAAIVCGFAVDLLYRPNRTEGHVEELCEQDGCHCEGKSVFLAALWHALRVALFIFLASFVLHTAIGMVGEENIGNLAFNIPVVGHLLAALIGLIPNCAASVVLTELYLEGAMSLGAMLSGLLVGAGVGVLVLFRANRHLRENCAILLLLYGIGAVLGMLFDLIGLGGLV